MHGIGDHAPDRHAADGHAVGERDAALGPAGHLHRVLTHAGVEVQGVTIPARVEVRRGVDHIEIVGAGAAVAPVVAVTGLAHHGQLLAGPVRAAEQVQLRRIGDADLGVVRVDRPYLIDVLVEVEQAARQIDRSARDLGVLAVQGQIVGHAAHVLHLDIDVRPRVDVGAGVGLAGVRAVCEQDGADRLAVDGGADHGRRRRHAAEARRELAAHVRLAELFVDREVLVDIVVRFGAVGCGFRMDAFVADLLQRAARGQDREGAVQVRQEAVVPRRRSGQRADAGDRASAGRDPGGRGLIGRRLIVHAAEADADIALVVSEVLGDVRFDLIAVDGVPAELPRAFADIVIAVDVIAQRVVDRAAGRKFELVQIVAEAGGQADHAARLQAGVADVVDDRAGRLRGEGGGRTAADRFDPVRGPKALPVVVVAEIHVAEQDGRQAVVLKLHEGRAARRHRQTAHREVGVTAGTRRVTGDDAGNEAQHFRLRLRRHRLQLLGGDVRHGQGGVQLALRARAGGHHDLVQHQRVVGGRLGRFGGEGRARSAERDHHRRRRHLRGPKAFGHVIPPMDSRTGSHQTG